MPGYLEGLNQQQLEAVRQTEGPLLIFAGAGSGKTRVLTCRIAHLILENRLHPEEVLAVTFTNKAAQEMKRRVQDLAQGSMRDAWVSTFHACCLRILRRHAAALDFTPQFAVYDRDDSLSLMKKVFRQLEVDPKQLDPRSVLQHIDRAKNRYLMPDDLYNDPQLHSFFRDQIIELYRAYQQSLHEANAMDFGDLLCNILTLFKLEPGILRGYRQQFRYMLVDEYQDTNTVQYLLIRLLGDTHRNICVVGDDDQSIYAFRGATIENILNFKKHYPEAHVINLMENYRSTRRIIEAANAVIAKNSQRQAKEMRTSNPEGQAVVIAAADDEHEEAVFMQREMQNLFLQGIAARDIAVLYRTNAQSRAIEEALIAADIPYEIFGGLRFYDRKEIKDILAYFRLILNPKDNEAFYRIVNTPTRGLGTQAIQSLSEYAQKNRWSLFEALHEGLKTQAPFLSSSNRKRFVVFEELILSLQKLALVAQQQAIAQADSTEGIEALGRFIERIAEASGYVGKLSLEETSEALSRIENIEELSRVAIEFAKQAKAEGKECCFHDFLDRASLASDLDKDRADPNRLSGGSVSLMTLHLAKGLEFEVVFLAGMEEGLLPHVRSLDSKPDIEEERRLCYVGMTRAKNLLYLSAARFRTSFRQSNRFSGGASRFLSDIPSKFLQYRGGSKHLSEDSHSYDFEAEALDDEIDFNQETKYDSSVRVIRRRAS